VRIGDQGTVLCEEPGRTFTIPNAAYPKEP
jgi:hypothetical protein